MCNSVPEIRNRISICNDFLLVCSMSLSHNSTFPFRENDIPLPPPPSSSPLCPNLMTHQLWRKMGLGLFEMINLQDSCCCVRCASIWNRIAFGSGLGLLRNRITNDVAILSRSQSNSNTSCYQPLLIKWHLGPGPNHIWVCERIAIGSRTK